MAITLRPLIGAHDGSGILCYLLVIDEGHILLDCGCPDRLAPGNIDGYLRALAELAPNLDLVILSHPVLSCVGLVPLLRARLGLCCPIYATLPTKEMGRWAAQEWVGQRTLEEPHGCLGSQTQNSGSNPLRRTHEKSLKKAIKELDLEPSPTLEEASNDFSNHIWRVSFKEIRDAFESVIAVRYSQPINLSGKLHPLTLTAHKSGHTLGGTIWTLRSPLHAFSSALSSAVIYALIFNHVRQRHFESSALVESTTEGNMRIGQGMSQPMVMIIGTERSLFKGVKKKDRNRIFLDAITQTLKSSHSVLIPSDPSARLIELLLLLDTHWNQFRLHCFPICLVSQTGKEVVNFFRSLTEWMSPTLFQSSSANGKRGRRDQSDQGPLRLCHLRIFSSIEDLDSDSSTGCPRVIIAIPMSMEYGFSRILFTRMASRKGNLIVLTSPGLTAHTNSLENGLGYLVHQLVAAVDHSKVKNPEVLEETSIKIPQVLQLNTKIKIELRRKVLLEGGELERYLEEERRANVENTKALVKDKEADDSGSTLGRDMDVDVASQDLNECSDSDEFADDKWPTGFDIYVKASAEKYRGGGRLPRFKMFPFVERQRRVDSYGEVIDADAWLKVGGTADQGSSGAEKGTSNGKDEDLVTEDPAEPPSKVVSSIEEIEVYCKVLNIDLDGKADGTALKTIIPQIDPKVAVLVNGSSQSNLDFEQFVAAVPSFTKQIFSPEVDEVAMVGHESKSFTVRLDDSIMKNLRFCQVEGYRIAYVRGNLKIQDGDSIPVLEQAATQKPHKQVESAFNVAKYYVSCKLKIPDGDSIPVLKRAETQKLHKQIESLLNVAENKPNQDAGPSKTPLKVLKPLKALSPASFFFIGKFTLGGLKARLEELDIPSRFVAGGVLVCGPASMHHYKKMMQTKFIRIPQVDVGSVDPAQCVGDLVGVTQGEDGLVTIEGQVGVIYKFVKDAVYSFYSQLKM
ncbi:hypothetical protein O181_031280 [Austropuccinia psidii MF-1]|uniref:Cleavage and polyadenylation specificity factor subunit 2 n=1 Tax=Austropuccinia psidii MF-1 TaxID=1389203 RepID=A0A9Q3CXN8_9BASI|nr:hypothetical protein [Austropuccinia psidii MF-1]